MEPNFKDASRFERLSSFTREGRAPGIVLTLAVTQYRDRAINELYEVEEDARRYCKSPIGIRPVSCGLAMPSGRS